MREIFRLAGNGRVEGSIGSWVWMTGLDNLNRLERQKIMTRLRFRILALVPLAVTLGCNVATAMVAIPDPVVDAPLAATKGEQTAVLAGGCFWGIEAVFEHVKGVIDAASGYAGGSAGTATYEKVSTGRTGHAEAVRIKYDPSQISYGQ
ncbi:MAG TPA: peptide-methionine (S)-S-oxide reductase, partial [Blastocatellia bacterium]|nr:peptide-methionine (S)-S-oxide reductase [Blastocatellia bacterium]